MFPLTPRDPNSKENKRDPRNYRSQYEYAEFPKYVKLPDGSGLTVNNEAEERAARGEDVAEAAPTGADPSTARPPRTLRKAGA